MTAMPILFLLILGMDEPVVAATSKPAASTSRPAIEFEFRPLRVIDHREKDVSAQFPSKLPRSHVKEWFGGSNPPLRSGLTLRCVLQCGNSTETWFVKDLRMEKVQLDKGDWPSPFEGTLLDGITIGEDGWEELVRFAKRSEMSSDEDKRHEVNLDICFKRPPRGARMISQLQGVLEIEVASTQLVVVEISKIPFGKKIDNATLRKAGIQISLNDPAKEKADDVSDKTRFISATVKGKLQNLVDVYPAEPPSQQGELTGPAIDIERKTTNNFIVGIPDNEEQTTGWAASEKLPDGARLVARVITGRRIVKVPFSFEEIFLPK